jgi:hypothetical protein
LVGPPCTTQYGVELQPEFQPCALLGAAAGRLADFDEVSRAPGLGLGDQGQDPGLGVRLLLARCAFQYVTTFRISSRQKARSWSGGSWMPRRL